MSEPQVKCSGLTQDYYQCLHNAKVERNAKWYCGQHDPVKVKERQEKRDKKWQEENAAAAAIRNAPRLRIKELEEQRDAALFELGNVVALYMTSIEAFCQWCVHIWEEREPDEHNEDCIVPRLEEFLKASKEWKE